MCRFPGSDQTDGALSSAAVPRLGLGPIPPPLRRGAECAIGLILLAGWVLDGCELAISASDRHRLLRNGLLCYIEIWH